MNILRVGSIVYKLRFGVAEEKIEIDTVTDFVAFSDTVKLKREYEGSKVQSITEQGLGRTVFGESFCVSDLSTVDRLENEILMRYIRNVDYTKFSNSEIQDIHSYIKRVQKYKEVVQ
jgi:hypothetical protein